MIIEKVILLAAFKQHWLQPLAPTQPWITNPQGPLFIQCSVVFSLWIAVHSADHFTATILADEAIPMHSQVLALALSALEGVDSDVSHTCELAAQT